MDASSHHHTTNISPDFGGLAESLDDGHMQQTIPLGLGLSP